MLTIMIKNTYHYRYHIYVASTRCTTIDYDLSVNITFSWKNVSMC